MFCIEKSDGEYIRKPLSLRIHVFGDGSGEVQRDLYSAFLAYFVEASVLNAGEVKLAFSGAEPLLQQAALRYKESASEKGFSLLRVPTVRKQQIVCKSNTSDYDTGTTPGSNL